MKDRVIRVPSPLGATVVIRDTANQDLTILKPGELVSAIDDKVLRKCGFVPANDATVEGGMAAVGMPDLVWETTPQFHLFPNSTVARFPLGRRIVVWLVVAPPGVKYETFGLKIVMKPAQGSTKGGEFQAGRSRTVEEGKEKLTEDVRIMRDTLCGGAL
jgi:hypothetical protein